MTRGDYSGEDPKDFGTPGGSIPPTRQPAPGPPTRRPSILERWLNPDHPSLDKNKGKKNKGRRNTD